MISFFCLSRIGSDCGGSSSSYSGGSSSVSYGNCGGGEQSQFQIIAVVDILVLDLRIQVAVVEGKILSQFMELRLIIRVEQHIPINWKISIAKTHPTVI